MRSSLTPLGSKINILPLPADSPSPILPPPKAKNNILLPLSSNNLSPTSTSNLSNNLSKSSLNSSNLNNSSNVEEEIVRNLNEDVNMDLVNEDVNMDLVNENDIDEKLLEKDIDDVTKEEKLPPSFTETSKNIPLSKSSKNSLPDLSKSSLPDLSKSSLPDLSKTSLSKKSVLPPLSPSKIVPANTNISPKKSSKVPVSKVSTKLPSLNRTGEELMKSANPVPPMEVRKAENEFVEKDKALPINSSMSKVKSGPTTASFEDYSGVLENQDIEKTLLSKGFIPTEKILSRDEDGNVICNYIKIRDKLGRAAYVELDCDYTDGMGFISISPDEKILSRTNEASVVPYSMKIGSYEANMDHLFGVGFECDNSFCVMSRKDSSLDPVETVFSHSKNADGDYAIQERHPIPFPVVKMTEILSNADIVAKNIALGHSRMRNIAFTSCMKDVEMMKKNSQALQNQIERFDGISSEVSNVLSCTINELEEMYAQYEKKRTLCQKDMDNIKAIQFNLQKRNDLNSDYIALCHSMRERAAKILVLEQELKSLNDFCENLFTGLSSVFVE